MYVAAFLILFPFAAALSLALKRKSGLMRRMMLFCYCAVIIAATLFFSVTHLMRGEVTSYITASQSHLIDRIMLAAEWGLVILVSILSIRHKKYYCMLLSVAQTGLITWLELSGNMEQVFIGAHLRIDTMTIIMCIIIGVIGCLICIYAMGYMKDFKTHHSEFKDRRAFFFAMLFVLLGAMFGLVMSDNLIWMYFFWEITSVCSFLLIGYNQSSEAVKNSFRALWMNLLGGLAFAIAICFCALDASTVDLSVIASTLSITGMSKTMLLAISLLAFAALTKSAQMPFSTWLLGAMVAPTPTSALLHSATMVKAGVYLLIRLAPCFHNNIAGTMVVLVGGYTFVMASILAIGQTDGKKVLAYSTVSNLGLICACAGIGQYESVWAAILLTIFHAVSKSLMFLTVGATENSLGSRNIEDMHGLIVKLPSLAFIMIIGIAGMFLAPFGMLVSKWAALKAFVDSKDVIMILFLVYGSATTLFYWTKWLGSIVAVHHNSEPIKNITKVSEWISLIAHAFFVVTLCGFFPLISSSLVMPYLQQIFNRTLPAIISAGNITIMIFMLILILVLPIATRILNLHSNKKNVHLYMSGINTGDDRSFVDSFGEPKRMYLANWYFPEYTSEKKLLTPSQVGGVIIIAVMICRAIGGVL